MKYFDRNSNPDRLPTTTRPLIQGLLANTQIFDSDPQDPSYVTEGVKYQRRPKDRRDTSEYGGDDEFVKDIIEIFGFHPLDFQVESWQLIRQLDNRRRQSNHSHGAIFSAPTGFGKTEAFLGPLYRLMAEDHQDLAVIAYPSRALLQDQLGRIMEHLHQLESQQDIDLSVGVWTGQTPYTIGEVENQDGLFSRDAAGPRFKLADCWCGDEEPSSFVFSGGASTYELICENNDQHSFSDRDLILNREDIINPPGPDILLTTLESLELFSLKPNYDIIDRVDTIVFDEIHLYTGLRGAHTANIAENIESVTDDSILWVGSSATVDDPKRFANEIFPVPSGRLEAVAPPDSDFQTDHEDKEHYYFLKTSDNGPGVSSMAIQQLMLLGHAMLAKESNERSKILSFIDSTSQVNQMRVQLEDADRENELWQFHRSGSGLSNWDRVAAEMDREFIESPLEFESVYSDAGFDAASTAKSDVLLSTSFLEVGIDVGDISIVTQYRTPWDLSSFIQRAGRAARKEETNSHIVVFLSNLTQDANMFYRADRFLGSEIRTPINTDNHVISDIHDQFETFYDISSSTASRWFSGSIDRKEAFLEEFLNDELGYDDYHEFIVNPSRVLQREFGVNVSEASLPALHGEEPVEKVETILARLKDEIAAPDLKELVNDESSAQRQTNLEQLLVEEIRDDLLEFCRERQTLADEFETSESALVEEYDSNLEFLQANIEELRTGIDDADSRETTERLAWFDGRIPGLLELESHVERIRRGAKRDTHSLRLPELTMDVHDIADRIDVGRTAIESGEVDHIETRMAQIDYLEDALSQLKEYNSIKGNDQSLYYVKYLLRGAYYYDRFLKVDGRSLADTVWYVPPNYFQDSGKYFTVFYGEDGDSSSEQSIDKLVHTYAPYRSEYQEEAGHLQAFLPKTVVEGETVRFSFEDIPGESRNGMITPDSITLSDVNDLSGGRALNIVRYCPECFQVLDQDQCLRHNDRAYGKMHSNPKVKTNLESLEEEDALGMATLAGVRGKVTLSGVALEVTPARPVGDDFEFIFTGEDRITQEIESGDTPLGFELDTRGLIFDVSEYISNLDDEVIESANRYMSPESPSVEEIAFHTAAHCFTHLVADIGGVNPGMLFYGIDEDSGYVYVFERSQGGQGIVDLVFEDFQSDPGTVLNALTHIGYNPQVINERLWGSTEFVQDLDDDPDESSVRATVSESELVPMFPEIVDLVVDEVLSTADRAAQLAKEEDLSAKSAYEIKQTVASERVDGKNEFPQRTVQNVNPDIEDFDRVKSLFFSPDIDGCVENLHLAECISGHGQSESLSYVLLEELREHLISRVSRDEADQEIMDSEMLPGGELDGTSVFITF